MCEHADPHLVHATRRPGPEGLVLVQGGQQRQRLERGTIAVAGGSDVWRAGGAGVVAGKVQRLERMARHSVQQHDPMSSLAAQTEKHMPLAAAAAVAVAAPDP